MEIRNPAYTEDDGLMRFIENKEREKKEAIPPTKEEKLSKNNFMVEGYPHVFAYWEPADFKHMGTKYTNLPVLEWVQMNKKRKLLIFEELFKLGWNDLQKKVIQENYRRVTE